MNLIGCYGNQKDKWAKTWQLDSLNAYCRLAFIRENFIFANIREFDVSRIQLSREIF